MHTVCGYSMKRYLNATVVGSVGNGVGTLIFDLHGNNF